MIHAASLRRRLWRGTCIALLAALLVSVSSAVKPGTTRADDGTNGTAAALVTGDSMAAFNWAQRRVLNSIAQDTWSFYKSDIDPTTNLPLDNLGPGSTRGAYTSAANIGVYLWAVVAARDLGVISSQEARSRITATLNAVRGLRTFDGFLFQWYDTATGDTILNPGQADCATEPTPQQDNCYFLSAVDNGWYASGLIIVRSAMPELRDLANSLIAPMNFGIFYDGRSQVACNTNPAIPGNQPTGQMYGGYYAGIGPATYHNGALLSDPRIAMYIGMGLHQMPGDVWWRTWRTLPPQQCTTDPDFSWQGQWPVGGSWTRTTDPVSGKQFNVWEGHYTYPNSTLTFVPTWAGGMFEALMPDLVVPETTWGPHSFGLADLREAQVQIKYATEQLHFPVWGLSPSSTADDTGGYFAYGVEGLVWPYSNSPRQGLSQCYNCNNDATAQESTVTPHASFIALDVLPQQAFANIQALRTLYPGVYDANGGFYDAVNPTTGAVGHRRLVLDESMIMAALDNALNGRLMQRYFALDLVSSPAFLALTTEHMSLQ